MLNNYTMSRDERIFWEPDSFIPDRWLRAEVASWHPFSAIPFGYGVRSCVGKWRRHMASGGGGGHRLSE